MMLPTLTLALTSTLPSLVLKKAVSPAWGQSFAPFSQFVQLAEACQWPVLPPATFQGQVMAQAGAAPRTMAAARARLRTRQSRRASRPSRLGKEAVATMVGVPHYSGR